MRKVRAETEDYPLRWSDIQDWARRFDLLHHASLHVKSARPILDVTPSQGVVLSLSTNLTHVFQAHVVLILKELDHAGRAIHIDGQHTGMCGGKWCLICHEGAPHSFEICGSLFWFRHLVILQCDMELRHLGRKLRTQHSEDCFRIFRMLDLTPINQGCISLRVRLARSVKPSVCG